MSKDQKLDGALVYEVSSALPEEFEELSAYLITLGFKVTPRSRTHLTV